MQYTVGFNGAASAELGQLLHAVEGQLNHRGFQMLAAEDTPGPAEAGSPAGGKVPPGNGNGDCYCTGKDCEDTTHGGHAVKIPCPGTTHGGHAQIIIIVGIVVLLLVGAYFFGKRSASRTSRN